MKTTTAQKAKIGMFTLAGIVVLVIGIFIIGSKKNMFGDTFTIYGTFRNVGGLQVGNNIRFAGINVGTVEGISIVNDTTVRVNMLLQSRVHQFLKNDAIASIGSDGLMGDKLVTIAPGVNGDKTINRGGQIMTANPVDYDKMIARVTHVIDNAEVITASLASISAQVSSGKGSIGRLLYSDDLQRGLVSTINSAHSTMESAKKGTEGFTENMEALKHNFLLRGYYKKKAREDAPDSTKSRKELRKERREERRDKRKGIKPGEDF